MFRCNCFQIKLQIQKPLIVNFKIRNSQKFQSIVSFFLGNVLTFFKILTTQSLNLYETRKIEIIDQGFWNQNSTLTLYNVSFIKWFISLIFWLIICIIFIELFPKRCILKTELNCLHACDDFRVECQLVYSELSLEDYRWKKECMCVYCLFAGHSWSWYTLIVTTIVHVTHASCGSTCSWYRVCLPSVWIPLLST